MNFHKYYPVDVVNGPGTRCVLFVAGCIHKCPGCYNKTTWRPDSGKPFTQADEDRIVADLNDKRIRRRGLSLSGGDPLYPGNVPSVLRLVERVRAECAGKDIWLWTGYTLAELDAAQRDVVALVDVVIDGKFVEALKDPALHWRGSSNQVVHDMRQQRLAAAAPTTQPCGKAQAVLSPGFVAAVNVDTSVSVPPYRARTIAEITRQAGRGFMLDAPDHEYTRSHTS